MDPVGKTHVLMLAQEALYQHRHASNPSRLHIIHKLYLIANTQELLNVL